MMCKAKKIACTASRRICKHETCCVRLLAEETDQDRGWWAAKPGSKEERALRSSQPRPMISPEERDNPVSRPLDRLHVPSGSAFGPRPSAGRP